MSSLANTPAQRRRWIIAGAVALAAHLGVAGVVLAWGRQQALPLPEPVVLVEMAPDAASVPANTQPQRQSQTRPQPQPQPVPPQAAMPPIKLPPVLAPLPQNPVSLPPPAPMPQQMVAAMAPAPARHSAPSPPAAAAGPAASDPRGQKAELDYFALISAHLNRRKAYPAEARKARQEGVVVIRFTVDRNGNVSGESIKRGSGFALLDQATLYLLQRVAPLPAMPANMPRDSVTIALPIAYSLKTN